MTSNARVDVPQSRFITLIAWLTIVGSAIAIVPLGLAVLAVPLIAPSEAASLMPTLTGLVLVCGVQLIAGVGLLRRRNWARLAMVALLGVTCIWQGSDLLSPGDAAGLLPDSLTADPAVADLLATVHQLMIVMSVTIILGSLWLIYRLMRADVKAEFCA